MTLMVAGLQTAIPDDSKIKRRWKYADLFSGAHQVHHNITQII